MRFPWEILTRSLSFAPVLGGVPAKTDFIDISFGIVKNHAFSKWVFYLHSDIFTKNILDALLSIIIQKIWSLPHPKRLSLRNFFNLIEEKGHI